MDFAGRHVIVTGGSTGIGLATAVLLGRHGAKVSLIARDPTKLDAAVTEVESVGGRGRAFPADVTDRAALEQALASAVAAQGAPDGLFANAGGGGKFGPIAECADDDWNVALATNLTSVFVSIRAVLGAMIARGRGSIVVTGSLASARGMPGNVGYVAAKHGVVGVAHAAAAEGAPHGVRCNCLLPGFIDTPMLAELGPDPEATRKVLGAGVPMGRVGSAEEAAQLAAFLLSDAASHITAQTIAVDGGVLGTLIPR